MKYSESIYTSYLLYTIFSGGIYSNITYLLSSLDITSFNFPISNLRLVIKNPLIFSDIIVLQRTGSSDSLYFGNNPNGVNENSELLNSNLLTRINNVFNFYCKEKSNVNTENSSLLVSLSELCAEYEVNFRKMIL